MSTRRARIKAVTSLPQRRKNDNTDKNKSITASKEEVEKILKSPKTPKGLLKSQESLGKHSPNTRIESPWKSPRGRNNVLVSQPEQFTSPLTNKDATTDVTNTSKLLEKNSNTIKPLFVSPKSIRRSVSSSPIKKPAAVTPNSSAKDPDIQGVNKPEIISHSPNIKHNVSKSINVDNNNTPTEVISDVPNDYNLPSVPESVTEDEMDGIVPLQTIARGPKPIALLKNEIISENAEVLFDPIVPLPSPSKVRPKLRPVPRLNPIRRNSVQGSASESEDESRRALLNAASGTPAQSRQRTESHTSISTLHSLPNRDVTRVRNDSVSSSISHITGQPAVTGSPLREKFVTKCRRRETSRRMAAMRRRRETAKSGALTMYDLIFYNPTTNPIVLDEDELNAKEANEKVESIQKTAPQPEDNPDDPPVSDAAPVPQIKLGPNGEIILDEQSLVIKQSAATRKVSSSVVVEGSWSGITSGRYKRGPRTADWSDAETVRFYRALAALGTDFMLMERLFPGRTRRDLKLKFKKEERVNAAQVDKALRTSSKWDATKLEEEFTAEREAAERRAKADAERVRQRAKEERERNKLAKELRVRQSKAAKAMETSMLPDYDQGKGLTADDFIRRHLESKAQQASKTRRKNPKNAPRVITPQLLPIAPAPTNNSQFAQLTLINTTPEESRLSSNDMATLKKIDAPKTQEMPSVPANIEAGSLVVLTVNDPNSPSKKMLQTYIAHGEGNLTPVALPPMLLNSVVSYMKKGTPKSTVSGASSPSSMSQDSRSTTPGVIIPSPAKRQRHSSYSITQL